MVHCDLNQETAVVLLFPWMAALEFEEWKCCQSVFVVPSQAIPFSSSFGQDPAAVPLTVNGRLY